MPKQLIANVYVEPFPCPIPWRRPYTKKFVRDYALACRRRGQQVRIEWFNKEGRA